MQIDNAEFYPSITANILDSVITFARELTRQQGN